MVRSILSVLAGYAIIVIVVMVTSFVSVPFFTGVSNPQSNWQEVARTLGPSWYLFEFIYSIPAGFAGGFVTALLARRAERQHAIALAGLMLLMGVASVAMSRGFQPAWHSVAVTLAGVLACIGGGFFRARQVRNRA